MGVTREEPLVVADDRFARFELIEWWDQARLRDARILVVGAGALGNEVLKNLALLGVGHVVLIDMDRVELSNLNRSVLFRDSDEGEPKALAAARAVRGLYPEIRIQPIVGNVLADLGLGYFAWAQVVVGALDNREARVFVNSACAMVNRPWIDGGIEVLQGIVRGFAPPVTSCYECTMSQVDWDLLNHRRSCSLLARRAMKNQATPTTPTTASVVGAIQVQEVVKLLHGMEGLLGRGFVFDGAGHTSYGVTYPIDPACGWHDQPPPIESITDLNSESALAAVWERAAGILGGIDALDLSRDLVAAMECPSCGQRRNTFKPPSSVPEEEILCGSCREECFPHFIHSVTADDRVLAQTIRELGLPSWDIVWARLGEEVVGIEIAGDHPHRAPRGD